MNILPFIAYAAIGPFVAHFCWKAFIRRLDVEYPSTAPNDIWENVVSISLYGVVIWPIMLAMEFLQSWPNGRRNAPK